MRRQVSVLATLVVVVLAGCNAPLVDGIVTPAEDSESPQMTTVPATPEPRRDVANATPYPDTPTPQPADVEVSEELPVDTDRVFARVRQLLGSSASAPTVTVYSGPMTGGTFNALAGDQFERLWGIGPPEPVADSNLQVGGATLPSGSVYLFPRAGRPAEIERTLAHEFTHTVQFAQDARRTVSAELPVDRRETSDGRLVERSILEGAAVYTATEYVERYQPRYPTERTQIDRLFSGASPGTQLYWSAYYHGDRYVDSRVQSPENLSRVYQSPPETTEQLLHESRDDPVDLRVYAGDGESPWAVRERDSHGELFLRIALRTQVTASRAERAAAGWGNDEVLTFGGPDGPAYVWVVRFDDEANASEFERTADSYLDGHATPTQGRWENELTTYRMDRIDERTVALVAGDESFVTDTLVRSEPRRVFVRPPVPDG